MTITLSPPADTDEHAARVAEHAARVAELEARVAELEATLNRVRDLCQDPRRDVLADTTYVVASYQGGHQNVDNERVFQRMDRDKCPHPDGDWWEIGPNVSEHPASYGEVLWLDDPECDRGTVGLVVLVSVEAIFDALNPPQLALCPTCRNPVEGLLAPCPRPKCQKVDIDHDAAMARLEDQ